MSKENGKNMETAKPTIMLIQDKADASEEIYKLLSEQGISAENIIFFKNPSEAYVALKENRERIADVLLYDQSVGGPAFFHIAKTLTQENPIPCIVTSDRIDETCVDDFKVGDGLRNMLTQVQQHLGPSIRIESYSAILPEAVHALIVHSNKDVRDKIIQLLKANNVPEKNIHIAENPHGGLDEALKPIIDKTENEGKVVERREYISLLFLEDNDQSSCLANMLFDSAKKENTVYPFMVALKKGQDIGESWGNIDLDLENLRQIDESLYPTFSEQEVLTGEQVEEIEKRFSESSKEFGEFTRSAKIHMSNLVRDQYEELRKKVKDMEVKAEGQEDEAQNAEGGGSVKPEKKLIITPGESEDYFCFYEKLGDFETLKRFKNEEKDRYDRFPEIKKPLRNQRAALFDVDGTLAQGFVMGRFAEFLSRNDNFRGLLSDVPKKAQAVNLGALRTLLNITKYLTSVNKESLARQRQFREIAKLTYEDMINLMNKTYAEMLSGLKVRRVCQLGYRFSKDDCKEQAMPYAQPIIKLVQNLGIVPTLLTGMPAETIGGYKKTLGIRERCYPLELGTKGTGGDMIYGQQVINSGGLATDKSDNARGIEENGNSIELFMGDQVSDISPMHLAMQEHDGAIGKGFLMIDMLSSEGQQLYTNIVRNQMDFKRRGHLVIIDKNENEFTILKRIIQELRWVSAIRSEIRKGKEDNCGKWKEYMEYLMLKPLARTKDLYKSSEKKKPTTKK